MIKKLTIFFVLIFIISCSKDEDDRNSIYGVWKLTSFVLDNQYDLNNDGIASNDVFSETGCYTDVKFMLNEDNTIYFYESETGSMSVTNFIDSYDVYCLPTNSATYTWTLEGSAFRIVFSPTSGLLGDYDGEKITFITPSFMNGPSSQNNNENQTVVYTRQ